MKAPGNELLSSVFQVGYGSPVGAGFNTYVIWISNAICSLGWDRIGNEIFGL